VSVVRVMAEEVRRDTEDDQGGDGVQCMIRREKRAMKFVRADGGGAVVGRWSCGSIRVGAASECHC
jgi:hypothetical protein